MYAFEVPRRFRIPLHLLLCLVPLLGGCALVPSNNPGGSDGQVLSAFVVIGENGAAQARAIVQASKATDAATPLERGCPILTIDGSSRRMSVRVAPGTMAQRPTASDTANSKPSMFPVLVCESPLPTSATRAAIGDISLSLPRANPQRIIVIGDTGCRMKKADNAWQACVDMEAWPLAAIADAAAAFAPDLVIHVGDFHYRENACPDDMSGCRNSPWGYGWDTWQADFFAPAAKLLAAAPWVVVRGNHEECRRAGQGWFRFLDVRTFEDARSCNDAKNDSIGNFTPPYSVPLSPDMQLIVFDSAVAGFAPLDPAKPRDAQTFAQYQRQFMEVDAIAAKPGVRSIFVNHHPILGYSADEKRGVRGGNAGLLSVMNLLHPQAYYPSSVTLALHGHVHLFEAMNFSSNHPATIVSGIGGDELSLRLPEPFPMQTPPADGVVLESITHGDQFGFVVMEKQSANWQITAHDHRGKRNASCVLTGPKLSCNKTGLLK
ncbi:MAG: metallophosphoesterase [Usitatibacteraceae bacterium]